MRRQIQDYVREVRGDVKTHDQWPSDHVIPLSDQDYGAAEAARQAAKPSAPPRPPSEEAIRERAYECWEAAGRPEGDGVRFWLEAERELAGRQGPEVADRNRAVF